VGDILEVVQTRIFNSKLGHFAAKTHYVHGMCAAMARVENCGWIWYFSGI
jgi:hypothetical protein